MIELLLWLYAVAAALGVGFLLKRYGSTRDFRIVPQEFVIGSVIIAVLIVPLTNLVGTKLFKAESVRYEEFWNGYEVAVQSSSTSCEKNGSCRRVYDCDPHWVTTTTTDSEGKQSSTSELEWDSCPYATEEHDYWVETTLGRYVLADNVFAPQPVLFRASKPLPGDVPYGPPQFWQEVRARVAAGKPGPVTVVKPYPNYILASQQTLLKEFSADMEDFAERGLLPDHTRSILDNPIHTYYHADKLAFVGREGVKHPKDERQWQQALAGFNAALGTDLQGDLHVVVLDANLVDNPDAYIGALSAWWQSERFGKRAISKNAVILAIGLGKGKVQWARAATGMPKGNEAMLLQIQNELPGTRADPEAIFGSPTVRLKQTQDGEYSHQLVPGKGALARIMWGEHKFQRVCMLCREEGLAGYVYLNEEIPLGAGQKTGLFGVSLVLSGLLWLLFMNMPFFEHRPDRSSYGSYYR